MLPRNRQWLLVLLAFLGGCATLLLFDFSGHFNSRQFGEYLRQNLIPEAFKAKPENSAREHLTLQSYIGPVPRTQVENISVRDRDFKLPAPANGSDGWKQPPVMDKLRDLAYPKTIPDQATLATYSVEQLSMLFHSYLDNADIVCRFKLRMGRVGDGGWEMCDDPEWRPVRPCIVYSFGINNDFSFDDDTAKIYGCRVYSFDPSMAAKSHNRSSLVTFYDLGIGGKREQWKKSKGVWEIYTLSGLKQMLKHDKAVIDVIKMDVENSEWPALDNMLKEKQLQNVRQLLVEYHHGTGDNQNNTMLNKLSTLRGLQEAGFRKFLVHKNFYCQRNALAYPIKRTSCYEIHYVNVNFARNLDDV